MTNAEKIQSLSVSISDNDFKQGLCEIINNLRSVEIDTFAMNDHTLFLQGQKAMLDLIIDYLERCL